jgi:hypothetical protein
MFFSDITNLLALGGIEALATFGHGVVAVEIEANQSFRHKSEEL